MKVSSQSSSESLYLDKNGDVGVSFRREGPLERFPEAPREGYGFDVDLSLQELWHAAVATKAFHESQEVSNCQHFVLETLQELAKRRHVLGVKCLDSAKGPLGIQRRNEPAEPASVKSQRSAWAFNDLSQVKSQKRVFGGGGWAACIGLLGRKPQGARAFVCGKRLTTRTCSQWLL